MPPEPGWPQHQHPDLHLDQVHLRPWQEIHRHRLRDLALRLPPSRLGGTGRPQPHCSGALGCPSPRIPRVGQDLSPPGEGGSPGTDVGQDGGGCGPRGGSEGREAAAPVPPSAASPSCGRRAGGREGPAVERGPPGRNKYRPWKEMRSPPQCWRPCSCCCAPRDVPWSASSASPPPHPRPMDRVGVGTPGCCQVLPKSPFPWGHPILPILCSYFTPSVRV